MKRLQRSRYSVGKGTKGAPATDRRENLRLSLLWRSEARKPSDDAGIAQWECTSFPSWPRGFDSRYPLIQTVFIARDVMSDTGRGFTSFPRFLLPPSPLTFLVLLVVMTAGCAQRSVITHTQVPMQPVAPLPQADGSSYHVQRGETLWRIAHDFGWDADHLARVNRLSSPEHIRAGQRLFIPPPPASNRFLWPARGALVASREGGGESTDRGLDIRAPEGSFVRASRTGRVAVATRQLVGWGKTVVLDHGDGYVTVYAGLEQVLVSPGTVVQQGNTLGQLGREPLYFEIRYGTSLRNPRRLLP